MDPSRRYNPKFQVARAICATSVTHTPFPSPEGIRRFTPETIHRTNTPWGFRECCNEVYAYVEPSSSPTLIMHRNCGLRRQWREWARKTVLWIFKARTKIILQHPGLRCDSLMLFEHVKFSYVGCVIFWRLGVRLLSISFILTCR